MIIDLVEPGLVALQDPIYLAGSMSVTAPLSSLPPGPVARIIREQAGVTREQAAVLTYVSVNSVLRYEEEKVRSSTSLDPDAYRRLLAVLLIHIRRNSDDAYRSIQRAWAAAVAEWPGRYAETKTNPTGENAA